MAPVVDHGGDDDDEDGQVEKEVEVEESWRRRKNIYIILGGGEKIIASISLRFDFGFLFPSVSRVDLGTKRTVCCVQCVVLVLFMRRRGRRMESFPLHK